MCECITLPHPVGLSLITAIYRAITVVLIHQLERGKVEQHLPFMVRAVKNTHDGRMEGKM